MKQNLLLKVKELVIDDSDIFLSYLTNHLRICFFAVLISTIIGVALGVLAAKRPKIGSVIVNTANFLRLIPTIALLVLLMPVLGSGTKPALLALCFVCIPVQIINTRLGVISVDPRIIEAAKGMGMDQWRCLFTIEIPLAVPMIVTGFRIAMIEAISGATIASYIGSDSLGNYITRGFFGGVKTHFDLDY